MAPSIALTIACIATIVNVKKGYVDYDPTHNKVFARRGVDNAPAWSVVRRDNTEESDEGARKK